MSARDTLFKRTPKAVDLDGDTFYVRSLTLREATRVDEMNDAKQTMDVARYAVAHCLTDDAGQPLFADGDTDMDDMPLDRLVLLFEAIKEQSSPPSRKAIRKNSEAAPSSPPV